jgi:hypothetical protein
MYYLLLLLASTLSALPFGQCIVCSYFWPMYYLLLLLASALKRRADNTLTKRKSRQCTGQKEELTIHWPKGGADNTLTKWKSRQYTVQKEEQTMHWPKGRADNTLTKRANVLSALTFGQCIVCSSFWSVYCLLFLLASVLSALPYGQCIICSSFWPVYCLLFLLVGQKEEQTIH